MLLLLQSAPSEAGNLIVVVKDAENETPISGATVSVVQFDEKKETWRKDWWATETKGNGIALRLDIEMWQRLVVKAEAKGYFPTFYGMPFSFYGVPEIVTISSPNTRLEIFLQSEKGSSKPEVLRTVKK